TDQKRIMDALGLADGLLNATVSRLVLDERLQILLGGLALSRALQLKADPRIVGIEADLSDAHGLMRDPDVLSSYNQHLFGTLLLCHCGSPRYFTVSFLTLILTLYRTILNTR